MCTLYTVCIYVLSTSTDTRLGCRAAACLGHRSSRCGSGSSKRFRSCHTNLFCLSRSKSFLWLQAHIRTSVDPANALFRLRPWSRNSYWKKTHTHTQTQPMWDRTPVRGPCQIVGRDGFDSQAWDPISFAQSRLAGRRFPARRLPFLACSVHMRAVEGRSRQEGSVSEVWEKRSNPYALRSGGLTEPASAIQRMSFGYVVTRFDTNVSSVHVCVVHIAATLFVDSIPLW